MRFKFKLGLVLVTSDCGITAECGVDKLVNIRAAHICTVCHTMSLCKNAKCDAYTPFSGTNSHNWRAENQTGVGLFIEFLPTPTTPGQTPSGSYYVGMVVVVVFKIGSKYVGITRSLATRRKLGIPKLLKWINKAQSEPCYKKTQLQSWSHFIFTRAQQPCSK